MADTTGPDPDGRRPVSGPVPLIDHAAVVGGVAAAHLADVLWELFQAGGFDHLPDEHRVTVARAIKAIVMAGERHRFRSGSDVGSSETPQARFRGRSAHESMSIAEAAEAMNVSDRRVRQLAPSLGARVGGVWVLERDLVEAEVARRKAS